MLEMICITLVVITGMILSGLTIKWLLEFAYKMLKDDDI